MLNRLIRAALVLLLIASAASVLDGYAYGGHKWMVAQIPYYINPVTSDMSETAAVTDIQAAAAAWSMQSNASISFYYMGRTSGTSLVNNGKNEVFFRADPSGAYLAQTYRWWDGSGKLVDADTQINDAGLFFAGNTGCSGGYYLQNVMTHEFGHALGFDHSTVTTATMYPGENMCTTAKESLDPDDIAAVEFVYPPSSSNTAPSVSISAPASNSSFVQGTAVTFSASATDKEDGTLSSGIMWSSSLDGTLGPGASISRVLSAGTHTITAQVTDSGGLTASATISVTITAPVNTAPSVTISAPANSSSDPQGTAVNFSGSANDKQDGNISANLGWTSNLDGNLGTGGSFSKSLSAGTHVITARVTDSAGLTSSSSVTITVTTSSSGTLAPIALTAQGTKTRNRASVSLSWTGSPASVSIYRNNALITTVSGSTYTDAVNGNGKGSYSYKACYAGTTTCSPTVSVRF